MTSGSSTDRSPLHLLRPLLWLAAAAFMAGFGGYLAIVWGARAGSGL